MDFDKEYVSAKLRRWEKYLDNYHLPTWENIPNLGLYMDQVVSYLKNVLDYLPPDIKEAQFITPATINNYVSRNIIPKPVAKKYYRIHLAYLIFICSLKQCLSTSLINNIVPCGLAGEEIEKIYREYAKVHETSKDYFKRQVALAASNILNSEVNDDLRIMNTTELLLASAVVSGFAGILAEKLIMIEGKKG